MTNSRFPLSPVFLAILILASVAMACNAPGATVTVTPLPPPTESAPQATNTTAPLPTSSPELATPTSPPSPVPPTPTQASFGGTTASETNLRSGPGINYGVLGSLAAGLPVKLTGRNDDKSWWQIEFSASPDGRAWVFAENVKVEAAVNTDALPVVNTLPPPTRAPTSVPTVSKVLRADNIRLVPGECTTLRWDVEGVKAVFLDAGRGREPVSGHDTRWVCPDATTVYKLEVVNTDDTMLDHILTVMVSGACGNTPIISRFEASSTHIKPGESVTFVWDVTCAKFVFFKGEGTGGRLPVGGHDRIEVWPSKTDEYLLIVVGQDDSEIKREITITVAP